ncbi:hypothetical protein ABTZ58_39245 [Streptomyces sp. NPDC094143]|uniref:hypothetical protein n=1 Tax=Streptomyces sp. NPDC094143 TaxID=3155310 RepID=UPI00332CD87D
MVGAQYREAAVKAVAGEGPPPHPRRLQPRGRTHHGAKDVCGTLSHELLPKNVAGIRAKPKHLVKLGILTESDTGDFARKQ